MLDVPCEYATVDVLDVLGKCAGGPLMGFLVKRSCAYQGALFFCD